MISRQTALTIAEAYIRRFTSIIRVSSGREEKVFRDQLYDFLYQEEYEPWFYNLAKANFRIRELKEWLMKIHTGESLYQASKDWSWEQRQMLGQRLLCDLAKDHLRWIDEAKSNWLSEDHLKQAAELLRRLELDGYMYKSGELLHQKEDVLNVEQEKSILQNLFTSANLGRPQDAFEFLRLAEEHFVAERWSDCISNVRKFFELTLQEGAKSLAAFKGIQLSQTALDRPVEVRQFLEREGLFERKERESLDKIYGLLSETGSHPYMAESDQARLLRQLVLTLSQFVLLRLGSATNSL